MAGFLRSFLVVVVLTAVPVSASACGDTSPTSSPTATPGSGVQGLSMMVGGLFSTPWPEAGVTIAVHEGDLTGAVVARTEADSTGAFKIDLAPGTYTLTQVSDGAVPKTVTVVPDQYLTVRLMIQAR